jgi:hypothetical protein
MATKQLLRSCVLMVIGIAVVLMLLPATLSAQSQAFTATLNGSVTDSSGAQVSGAKVTLTNAERGITRTFTTNDSGMYTFTLLPPASGYSLQVESPNFQTYKQTGIELVAGQSAQQAVVLKISGAKEQVVVEASAALVNAENPNVGSDITSRQIVELPLNLRNVYNMSLLNSSVNNSSEYQVVGGNGLSGTADQDVSFLNFGGTFFGTSAILLDGTWDTGSDWGGLVFIPSVDNVGEFKIQTNAFTAQYGWSSGNIVNVVTKSGSSAFHGDAYEFYRNSAMDAQYYFADKKPDFNRHQFGGAFGGPLEIPHLYEQKNKTFFFVSYEGQRSSTPANPTGTVPTDAMKSGDFSSQLGGPTGAVDALGRPILAGAIYNPFTTRQITAGQVDPTTGLVANSTGWIRDPFAGNKIPGTMFDSVSNNMLQYWPSPNSNNPNFNYSQSAASPFHSNEYSIRVDHNFTDNTRLNVRWSQKWETKTNSPEYYGANDPGGPGVVDPNNRWSINGGLNHVFSPTFDMSINLGLNRWVEQSQVQGYGFKASALGLPSFIDSISPLFPLVKPDSVLSLGPGAGNGLDEYAVPRNIGTASVDFAKIHGKHSLSFGFMDVLNQLNGGHDFTTTFNFPTAMTAGPDPQAVTSGTGAGMASFLLGVGNGQTGYNAWPASSKHYLGWYLQDDWKLTSKLTVNLGLRYEIQTAPVERHNNQVYFDPTAVNPISSSVGFQVLGADVYNNGSNRGLYSTPYNNFAPRIGFAYQALNKVVVRGGYGLFYIPSYPGAGPNQGFSQSTPWVGEQPNGVVPQNVLSNAFPSGMLTANGSGLGGLQDVGYGTTATYPDRRVPYVEQWMFGVQYSLSQNDLLDVSYVGNHGVHMLASGVQRNQLSDAEHTSLGQAEYNLVPNPFYGHITSSGCGLADPTIIQGQLLKPFPQYCSVYEVNAPVGFSLYDALQATYSHRWKSGLSLQASYTFSKFIDNVNGASGWAFVGSNAVRNFNNLAAEKSVDGNDIPHSLVINYVYELPVGHGKPFGGGWNGPVNAILGGWQLAGVTSFKSGFPLSIVCADNSQSLGGAVGRCNVIGNPVPANQTISNWINRAAFQDAPLFTYGNSARYLSNLRSPGYQDWDIAIQKYWRFGGETKRLQFRAEMYNAFNHPNFYAPNQNFEDPNFGKISNTLAPRDVQIGAKFYW